MRREREWEWNVEASSAHQLQMDIIHLLSYRLRTASYNRSPPMQSSAAQHFIVISLLNRLNAICQSTHLSNCSPHILPKIVLPHSRSTLQLHDRKKYVYCIHIECRSTFFFLFFFGYTKYLSIHCRNTHAMTMYVFHICVVSARPISHRKCVQLFSCFRPPHALKPSEFPLNIHTYWSFVDRMPKTSKTYLLSQDCLHNFTYRYKLK